MYTKTDVVETLNNAIKHVDKETYRWATPLPYGSWFDGIEDAVNILRGAIVAVEAPEPEVTVVVIDFADLERRVLARSIADADVQDLLPFHSKRVQGQTYVHIENNSGYTVETNSHFVRKGETLCKRQGLATYAGWKGSQVTCPGCLIKGKAIVVNHLLNLGGL